MMTASLSLRAERFSRAAAPPRQVAHPGTRYLPSSWQRACRKIPMNDSNGT